MKPETFRLTAGVMFTIVAAVHLLRLLLSWDVVIGNWHAPLWISGLGLAVSGFLGYTAFTLSR